MKLSIVSPEFPFSGRVPLVPPILEYLAAMTYREIPNADIQLIDANQRQITAESIEADTVAISVMTATAPWAYRFADDCRKIGKRVVMGGIHPSALPDEAAAHADCVVTGEAESVWGRVLKDIQSGNLQKLYHGKRQPLDNLVMPVNGHLKGNYQFRAFFTMRGCPYRCTFCSVRKFYGDTIRYRPVDQVVAEIENCAGNLWFNGDDNIWGGDPDRSIRLFDALADGKNRKWYGFGDLRSIQGNKGSQMLTAARRSGLFSVWVGWEGEEKNLGVLNAYGKQGVNREATVKRMQDAGIDVTLFVVLGGRNDSIESFKRTLDLSERLQVGIHPVLLTPLPGTELYEEYREHLIPGLGWDAFTGVNSVFEHPSPEMTPQRREEEYHRLSNELFKFERIVSRVKNVSSQGFPSTHIYSFMMQVPMKHALSKAYAEWKMGYNAAVEEPLRAASNLKDEVPVAALAERNDLDRSSGLVRKRLWLAVIAVISLLDIIELTRFGASGILDSLELLFLASSFAVLFALVYKNRREVFRGFDTLINWTADGLERKKLLIRQTSLAAMVLGGQVWGFACTFAH